LRKAENLPPSSMLKFWLWIVKGVAQANALKVRKRSPQPEDRVL
jgi:hypothetical protein